MPNQENNACVCLFVCVYSLKFHSSKCRNHRCVMRMRRRNHTASNNRYAPKDNNATITIIMARSCCETVDELKQELNSVTEKSKELKQEYQSLLIQNLQKDLTIRQFKIKLNQNKFVSFDKDFSKETLIKLNLIGDDLSCDSTFIGLVLNELYGQALKNKCLSGRGIKSGKSPISPQKKKIIDQVFAERLSHLNADESRAKKLNKLIRSAIDSANQKY